MIVQRIHNIAEGDSKKNLKLLHISDTHGFHREFPKETFDGVDIIVHSGDCSNHKLAVMNIGEVQDFMTWFSNLDIKHKIFVAGNHDTSIEAKKITPADFASLGITYLENSATHIEGIKFWGSPHTPNFGNWAFMKSRDKIARVWQKIPSDTEILIVHGPPKGIRDLSSDRVGNLHFCGDSSLFKAVMKIDCRLMLFGHIHDSDDCHNQGVSYFEKCKTVFSNATCVIDGKPHLGLTSFGNKFML